MFGRSAHSGDVTPKEEPVEPRTVVENDETWAFDLLQVSTHLHTDPIQ